MQNIARENNLSETAFVKIDKEPFSLDGSQLTTEVELDMLQLLQQACFLMSFSRGTKQKYVFYRRVGTAGIKREWDDIFEFSNGLS